ncbi:MAG: hypothetical protein ACI9DF_003932 [Verrucomicrobiales bacterium]
MGYAMRAGRVPGIAQDNGNIGIGTPSPADQLQIGTLASGSDQYLSIKSAGGNAWRTGIKFRHFSDEGGFNIEDDEHGGSSGLNFVRYPFGSPATAMFIDRFSGNVNIALSNPSAKLEVAGTVTGTAFVGDGSGLTNLPTAESHETVFPAQGMAWIKPGKFLMGSRTDEPGHESDETQHWVTLTKGFWMGVQEVTQAEYVAATGLANPSTFTGDTNRPVEKVSWTSAVAYCTALTTTERTANRIPADWEYRAANGDGMGVLQPSGSAEHALWLRG